jgi:uroporphyrin-3 C-methyltransferase
MPMTEDNHSPEQPAAEPGTSGTEPRQPAPARGSGGGRVLGVLALVISIAAAGVAGYLWYQVQVEQKLSQSRLVSDIKDSVNSSKVSVTALEKEFDALREQQRDLAARIDKQLTSRLDELESRQNTLAERGEALSGSIEQIYEELDRSLDSWALEEVEQLLRIANQSLRLSGDVATAIAGLELADRRLEELGNPAFLEVREELADNISSLKSLERVDVAGLALRLSSMAGKVDELPLAQKTERPIAGAAPDDGSAAEDEGESSGQWLAVGDELLQDLKKLVRIQNIDEPAKPLLTPEQRYFLFSNLRLMLSGAQIAALSKDTPTFHDNLAQAKQWIQDYFDTDHDGVQQFLADIDGMSGIELDPELPDISGSLSALQESKKRIESR